MDVQLELIDEFRLSAGQLNALRQLLASAFPDVVFTRSRTYLKQVPPRRLLAMAGSALIGQLGLEHRVIGTATGPATIPGIVDLCVRPSARRQEVASEMLGWVERLGIQHGIDFLMLFAKDPRLYTRNGYERVSNPLRWVKIHEHRTIGIGEEPLEELMVKPIGERPFPDGLVDLLGYQF